MKVVKNKVAAPFKKTEFDILYNEGISKEGEIIVLGEKFKIIEKSGNTYFYLPSGEKKAKSSKAGAPGACEEALREKIKLGMGYNSTRTFLKKNPKITKSILKEIHKNLAEEM